MDNKSIITGLVIGLLLGVVGIYGFFFPQITNFQEQISTMQTQISTLQTETSTLKTQVNTIGSENTALQTQVTTLTNQNNNLSQIKLQLEQNNTYLENKYADTLSQYNELIGVFNNKIDENTQQVKWTATKPTIDGIASLGEWTNFQGAELKYSGTDRTGPNKDPWDTKDKLLLISALRSDSHLYVCVKFNDDYLSSQFQRKYLEIWLHDGSDIIDCKNILWNSEYKGGIYPQNTYLADNAKVISQNKWQTDYNWGGTNDGAAQYSHSGNGVQGVDGIYTIEYDIPLRAVTGDSYDSAGGITGIEFWFTEQTTLLQAGTGNYEGYAIWRTDILPVNVPKPQYVINGDFETGRTDGEWGFDGWVTLGTVGCSTGHTGQAVYPQQNRYGGDASQTINFDNYPLELSFWIKPQPAGQTVRLQVQIDRVTILYDKTFTGSNTDFSWSNIMLNFTPPAGTHEIRFYVLPGPDYYPNPASSVGIDDVSITSGA